MNNSSLITRTILHRLGYRKAKTKSHFGHDWYFKRRITRNGDSRCIVKVEFSGRNYVNVIAHELAREPGAPHGLDYSDGLVTVRELKEWESFAFWY